MMCFDCKKNDGILSPMINVGDEIFKKKMYVILECVTCGSSIRIKKEK